MRHRITTLSPNDLAFQNFGKVMHKKHNYDSLNNNNIYCIIIVIDNLAFKKITQRILALI